ncbi:hypothetical protein TrLO_g15470 [Triparma laevis f. longispina]|uniref:Uncharacterized protein n=1 Tax=Triparma laevis f. longispina TaxID=1714387 RepID=A0A9W7C762_9STRA|nr:hypothetical protein TrLO_g15470 [Triparma laevis f. longispina]
MVKMARDSEQVKESAAEPKIALMDKIEKLQSPAQTQTGTGNIARRWRTVLFAGALFPHFLALASLKDGDQRFINASETFQLFGAVCSIAAAGGRNLLMKKGLS